MRSSSCATSTTGSAPWSRTVVAVTSSPSSFRGLESHADHQLREEEAREDLREDCDEVNDTASSWSSSSAMGGAKVGGAKAGGGEWKRGEMGVMGRMMWVRFMGAEEGWRAGGRLRRSGGRGKWARRGEGAGVSGRVVLGGMLREM